MKCFVIHLQNSFPLLIEITVSLNLNMNFRHISDLFCHLMQKLPTCHQFFMCKEQIWKSSTFLLHYHLWFYDSIYTSMNCCSSVLKAAADINVWVKIFYIKKERNNVLIAFVLKPYVLYSPFIFLLLIEKTWTHLPKNFCQEKEDIRFQPTESRRNWYSHSKTS